MSWLSGILGLLKTLPDLVALGKEFMAWLNHVSGNDPQGYIQKVGQAMSQLNSAQTVQERQDAAKAIADVISGL